MTAIETLISKIDILISKVKTSENICDKVDLVAQIGKISSAIDVLDKITHPHCYTDRGDDSYL